VPLSTEQLPRELARRIAPLYTVYGAEPLLALEAADRIRAKARESGYGEREILTVESGFNWADLRFAGRSLSLFAARRLLELRIPGGKPGVEGAATIEAHVRDLPPDTVTLVQLPDMDWRAVKAKWFTELAAAGVTVVANLVPRSELAQWIAGRLKAQGQHADTATLQFIADRVEGNLLAARQEVQKLGLLFPQGALAFEDVEQAVLDVARYDPYKLGEALFSGDTAYLLRMLAGLEGEGVAPPMALWSVAGDLRKVVQVAARLAAGASEQSALKAAKVWGPRQALIARAARRLPLSRLEDALVAAAEVDRIVKGLKRGDPWRELARLALSLASKGPPRARQPG
jgi:DNA polymerase-3 subunit delta